MEQKKTLWIVAATGIFLLVVVGAALILYSPSVQQSQGIQAGFNPESGWISSTRQGVTPLPDSSLAFNTENPSSEDSTSQKSEYALSPFASNENTNDSAKDAQNQDNLVHTDKLTVISDNATVYSSGTTTIDLNSLKTSSGSTITAQNELTENQLKANRQREEVASSSTSSTSARETYSAQENYYTPAPVAKAPAPKATPSKTVSKTTQSSTASAKSTNTVSKAATAAKVASSAKKAPDSFWVQAAAYTSKRNADEARTMLESNKIPSEVFTFTDSSGKTFYRVRVGPYVTKSEAEYWQTRIGMIDKFASAKSIIVNTAIN